MKTIRFQTAVQAEGRYIRHHSSPGFYGHVILRVEPSDESPLSFSWEASEVDIPVEYTEPVVEGVHRIFASDGLLPDVACMYTRVRIVGGSFHEVDSNKQAYRLAAFEAFKNALKQAGLLPDDSSPDKPSPENQNPEPSENLALQVKEKRRRQWRSSNAAPEVG